MAENNRRSSYGLGVSYLVNGEIMAKAKASGSSKMKAASKYRQLAAAKMAKKNNRKPG
jgi:hypothetical protein